MSNNHLPPGAKKQLQDARTAKLVNILLSSDYPLRVSQLTPMMALPESIIRGKLLRLRDIGLLSSCKTKSIVLQWSVNPAYQDKLTAYINSEVGRV